MTSVGETEWRDGTLWAHSPGCAARAWSRPADLAEARLATDPAVDSLARTGVQNSLTYYEAQYFFGGEYSKLTIESGAVFDIAGHFAYRVHDIVLNGGTSSPRTSRSCWTRRAATARNAASP